MKSLTYEILQDMKSFKVSNPSGCDPAQYKNPSRQKEFRHSLRKAFGAGLIDAVLLSRGSDQRLAAASTIVAPLLIDARHLHGEAARQFGAIDDVKRGTLAASRRGERHASTRGKTRDF
jgi:hypothetical protein